MPLQDFVRFLTAARGSTAMVASYGPRNLPQLVFHAKNDGYDFTAEDVAAVVGKLEANVILNKDGDAFDGSSRLWREMWGRFHLDYLVECCVSRHTDAELRALVTGDAT